MHQFTHLHCHSHYSLLDGLPKINDLVEKTKKLGMTALALTDHGVMYGAINFYNSARSNGIKPIIGLEAYISPRLMEQKEGKLDADYFHLTLLAENYQGYLNLIQLTTLAHTKGFYYKPRIDLQTLDKYSAGLIALSGCPRGQIARSFKNNPDTTQQILNQYLQIFSEKNFFLELQRTSLTDTEIHPNNELISLGKQFGVPVVATQDCHYLQPNDSQAQDVMVCIGTGRTVDEPNRLDMRSNDLSLTSPEAMVAKFSDVPEAISNTQLITNRINIDIPINQRYFATLPLPDGVTPEQELTKTVNQNARKKFQTNDHLPEHIQSRIDYELNIINQKGFAVYFLMVADIVQGAHQLGVLTNTRGSAAGSLVGYLLNISSIDPIQYQLPFERFLTLHRPTPPDIDLDIADDRRDEVIQWISDRYGNDKVAQIITFGTMKARAVIRDVGRALGITYGKCDRIAKMIPLGKQGFTMTLEKALTINPELNNIYQTDEETKRIIDIAYKLEGCVRHASIHAAALAITPTPLTDYMPLQLEPDGHRTITQYDMYSLDVGADSNAIGVVKMDLLGIRNLSILERAVKLIKYRHNNIIDVNNIPLDDQKTFQLLSNGLTFGVFQLGSSGMTRYLKELQPSNIFDISAMIALYRPGPLQFIPNFIARKHNPSLITYLDPSMEPILNRTYGILVYQDDLLVIAHDLAGYSWEEVDKFRKAVGKKIPEEMAKQKEKFIQGCTKTSGWSLQKATQIWTWIEPFAAYGFNKAHSASYAMVSYQTAYMKANFPVEFMAALMTAESGDEQKIYDAVEECKIMGIKVLPPDVNESYGGFTVIDDHTIRFGLNGIKNLGHDVVAKIIECHKSHIKFDNLEDFLIKSHSKSFNKKSWEALVKAGALDKFGERATLLANTEMILNYLRDYFKNDDNGQTSLFGKSLQINQLKLLPHPALSESDRLKYEKEHLGLFVTGHPLDQYQAVTSDFTKIRSITNQFDNHTVQVAGIITKLKRTITKKNEPMAFATLEDKTGSIEMLIFPKIMPQSTPFLESEQVIRVSGKISLKDGENKLILNEISPLPTDELYEMALNEMEKQKQLTIHIPDIKNQDTLLQIKNVLEQYPGNAPVYVKIGTGPQAGTVKTKTSVRISRLLIEQLRALPDVSMIYDRLDF